MRLTTGGQAFFSAVTRHLRGIAQAAERLKPRADTVMLTVVPTFASRWLMPHLPHFTQLYPALQVRMDASLTLVDFERERFDLGIRYSQSGYLGLENHLLFSETVVPLCSPSYREAQFAHQDPAHAWKSARLLHENVPDFWPQWIAGVDFTGVDADAGLYFSHGLLVLSAAIEGQGVALQPLEFVERELASGALVLADERELETGRGYYLVWPRRELRPAVERFRDWVIAEIQSGTQVAQLPAFSNAPPSSGSKGNPAPVPHGDNVMGPLGDARA